MDIEVITLIVGIFIQLFIASVAFTSLLIIQRINQRIANRHNKAVDVRRILFN